MLSKVISVLIPLVIFLAIVLVQIKLSKSKSIWPGLVIPIICILFSIITVANIGSEDDTANVFSDEPTISDTMTQHTEVRSDLKAYEILSMICTDGYLLIIYNLPTFILMCVYVFYRGKIRKQKEKMKLNIY